MAYRPLQIACWVLLAALSLTATLSVTQTGLRGAAVSDAAVANTNAADALAPVSEAAAATPGESRPFPNGAFATVLADGPNLPGAPFQSVSIVASDDEPPHYPRPEHRGFEELPPPPDDDVSVALNDRSVYNPPATVAVPDTAPQPVAGPIQDLVSELTRLRSDLQQFGHAAQGHSAVQAEMQSLRTEIAALTEQRRLDDLHQDIRRIAQRQDELETQLEPPTAPPVPAPVATPTPPPIEDPEEAVAITPVDGHTDRWSAQLIEADPARVIRRLSEIGKWNLVLGSEVRGTVSLAVSASTADELLQAVVASLGCAVIDDGPARLIVPADQAAERRMATEQTVAKLLRPMFIAAPDLVPLIRPMLTPGLGELALTPDGPVAESSPPRAQSDAILVVDFPGVIAQVESMLAEVDVPPEQFVIDAVITTVLCNQRTQYGVVPALSQAGVCSAPQRRDRGQGHGRDRRGQTAQFRGSAQELLQQMQQLADTHIEATPSLHVLNRQLAEIEVGANVAYREHVAFGKRLRLLEEEIDFLPSRTHLCVRPFLQDADSVRLQVHPRVTHVRPDPITRLPREELAELSTDITIPLGCTAVIGGLTRSTSDNQPASGPMQGLFGRRNRPQACQTMDDTSTIEVVILLTPRRACDPPVTSASAATLPTPSAPWNAQPANDAPHQEYMPPAEPAPQLPPPPAAFQPAVEHSLFERLLGRRLDSPPHTPEPPAPATRQAPQLDVPAPELESADLALENDAGDWATLTASDQAVWDLAPIPVTYESTSEQASAETVVIDPVPPEPAPLRIAPTVDLAAVPPPPPEPPLEAEEAVHGPAPFIPPPPEGRPRRRVERVERHDPKERRERHDEAPRPRGRGATQSDI